MLESGATVPTEENNLQTQRTRRAGVLSARKSLLTQHSGEGQEQKIFKNTEKGMTTTFKKAVLMNRVSDTKFSKLSKWRIIKTGFMKIDMFGN